MLHLLIVTLAGLSSLWVLMLSYIFTGLEFRFARYDFHLSFGTFQYPVLTLNFNFLSRFFFKPVKRTVIDLSLHLFCSKLFLSETRRKSTFFSNTHSLISASFSSFKIFGKTFLTDAVSKTFSYLFLINNSKLLMFVFLALYKGVYLVSSFGGDKNKLLFLSFLSSFCLPEVN